MSKRALSGLLLGCGAWVLAAAPASGEPLVGLSISGSNDHALFRFDSATPGLATSVNVTGLIGEDRLLGMDRRVQNGPNNGTLYAIAANPQNYVGRIYSLNETTGAATLVSTLFADPADTTPPTPYQNLFGVGFAGVDFNPVVDRLRVVTTGGFNLRIDVDTGAVQRDVPVAYQTGDPGAPFAPAVSAVAYSNSVPGATSTVLTAIDGQRAPDHLGTIIDPNGGVMISGRDVPFFTSGLSIGYDISGATGIGYIMAVDPFGAGLWKLEQGAFSKLGVIGSNPGPLDPRGLAAGVGAIPEPETLLFMVLGLAATFAFVRRNR